MPTPFQLLKQEANRLGIKLYPGISEYELSKKVKNRLRYMKQKKIAYNKPKEPTESEKARRKIKDFAYNHPSWDNDRIASEISRSVANVLGFDSRHDAVDHVLGKRSHTEKHEKHEKHENRHTDLEKMKKNKELLTKCGAKCFSDNSYTLPICPLCDSHKCYCYPECAALKKAYDRGHNTERMEAFAKRLDCDWLSPPPISYSGKRVSSLRRSSGKDTLVGKTFVAPDGMKHRIVAVTGDKAETITAKGQRYRVPLKIIMKLL